MSMTTENKIQNFRLLNLKLISASTKSNKEKNGKR